MWLVSFADCRLGVCVLVSCQFVCLQKLLLNNEKMDEDSGVSSRKSDSSANTQHSELSSIDKEYNLSHHLIKDDHSCTCSDLSKRYVVY